MTRTATATKKKVQAGEKRFPQIEKQKVIFDSEAEARGKLKVVKIDLNELIQSFGKGGPTGHATFSLKGNSFYGNEKWLEDVQFPLDGSYKVFYSPSLRGFIIKMFKDVVDGGKKLVTKKFPDRGAEITTLRVGVTGLFTASGLNIEDWQGRLAWEKIWLEGLGEAVVITRKAVEAVEDDEEYEEEGED